MTNEQIKELGLLIEGLKLKEQPDGSKDFHPYIYELVRAALARACQPQWISVDERLPESEGFYLVYLFDGHRDEWATDILWWNTDHQQFLEWDFMNNATHWMPLPEPPKNKGD